MTSSLALATLLTILLPAGAEPYLSEDSVYAEIEGVDVTVLSFDEALGEQAMAEFRETHDDPSTARAGVIVEAVTERRIAGREAVLIDYTKPAAIARYNDQGDVELVAGLERTRQIYLDLGTPFLVLTVWSKTEGADIAGVAESMLGALDAGAGTAPTGLDFRIGGASLEEAGATLPDILASPLRIDIHAE